MYKTVKAAVIGHLGLLLVLFYFISIPDKIIAGGKPHPMQGVVTALGTSQDTTGGGTGPVFTHVHRTYTVKTEARIFVLECPYDMEVLHIVAPAECGGKKKFAIGDTLHFRLEKNSAFVVTDQGKDQKLKVVSEAMNEAGNSTPAVSQQLQPVQ